MVQLHKIYCTTCERPFFRTTHRVNESIKLGHRSYCSKECESKSRLKRKTLVCENVKCGKFFERQYNDILSYNYCSRSCAASVNNEKFPKRGLGYRICVKNDCKIKFKGSNKYCSKQCREDMRRSYSQEDVLFKIKSVYKKYGRIPTRRELRGISDASIYYFGSWNNAVIAAGFTPHRSHSQCMYKRINTKAIDGHLCDSISEAIIDNWFTEQNINHERNVSYPETKHKADWRIQNLIFVEYFGLAKDSPRYDRAIRIKKDICREHGIKLIDIYPSDLYPKQKFDKKLKVLLSDVKKVEESFNG